MTIVEKVISVFDGDFFNSTNDKMLANRIFDITFDRNNIKRCGFHRSKEAVSLHSSMYYSMVSNDNQMVDH